MVSREARFRLGGSPDNLVRKPPSSSAGGATGARFGATKRHAERAPGRQYMGNTAPGVQQGPFSGILNTSCGGLGPQVFITGGAPTTMSPVSAMCFLRRRRKNIADTGEIVVGAPPVFKEGRRPTPAGARTGQPPHKEASQEAPKHCTGAGLTPWAR